MGAGRRYGAIVDFRSAKESFGGPFRGAKGDYGRKPAPRGGLETVTHQSAL
jgi:hypothetical protein